MLKCQRIIVENEFKTPLISKTVRFAFVSDLHNDSYDDLLPVLRTVDAVLVNGDLVDRHSSGNGFDLSIRFLNEVTGICPIFYSIGNHELKLREREAYLNELVNTKAVILDNEDTEFSGIAIGGLTTDLNGKSDTVFLDRFENGEGYKLLLCHQPETWNRYVRGRKIDLTLCGHAHGGQIQVAGHGIFSPGQGLFPKYTHGFYDHGKMLISRGLSNNTCVPRVNNPCELHIVTVSPDML